jgi:hypothetical protein
MKKVLSVLLLVSALGASAAYGACHSCTNWINRRKPGAVRERLARAYCRVKRGLTGRECCESNCCANYEKYKDRYLKGTRLCERCGKHHICNTCGNDICYKCGGVCHTCQKNQNK